MYFFLHFVFDDDLSMKELLDKYLSPEVGHESQYLFANKHFKTDENNFSLHIARVFSSTMNFHEAIVPFHLWSKLSGVTIFSVKAGDLSAKFRKADVVFILATVYGSFYLYKFFFSMFQNGYSDSKLIEESLPALLYGKFIINILCVAWTTLARNKIAKVLRLLHEFDEMVRSFDETVAETELNSFFK